MTRLDRRSALQLAAIAALLPTCVSRAAHAASVTAFLPPSRPMLYTRRLRRTMADGSAFEISRSFSVRFVSAPRGYRVEGEQVDVSVSAPSRLSRFADLERARREEALFPLTLDASGLIAGAAAAIDPSKLASAVEEATREIDAAGLGAGDRAEAARFFASLDRNLAQVIAQLPRDLFAPRVARRQASHDVALPGGGAGAVSVSFTAAADPATGVMREAEREIVTDLGGDRRLTVESWQLKPL